MKSREEEEEAAAAAAMGFNAYIAKAFNFEHVKT